MGVPMQVCADPSLAAALAGHDYERPDGSRFVRTVGGRTLAIDVVTPSYEGTLLPNQVAGTLVVDAVPGLGLALARPATIIDVAVTLSDGRRTTFRAALPDVRAALVLKAYAYRGRLATKDAVDIWRLLEAARAAGLVRDDWPKGVEARDAARCLTSFFGAPGSRGAARATADRAQQARIRALVNTLIP